MIYCSKCGKSYPDNATYCNVCNDKLYNPHKLHGGLDKEERGERKHYADNPQTAYVSAPAGKPYHVLSFGAYIGLLALAFVPVANIIAMCIGSFNKNNRNLANFCRALLVVVVVLTGAAVALYFLTKPEGFELLKVFFRELFALLK